MSIEKNNGNLSYKLCNEKQINPFIRDILKKNNINQNKINWQIYLPRGYNNIGYELKTLQKYKDKLIFGIDGCDNIIAKDNMWKILVNYYGEQCSNIICPKTYLNTSTDILKFRNEYKKNTNYILKKYIRSQKGLYITQKLYEILYKLKNEYVLVQEMLKNPFCIQNYKIIIRIYILVICEKNNKQIYYHQNGIVYYTPNKFLESNTEFDRNITSGHIFSDIDRPSNLEQLHTWFNINGCNWKKFRGNMHHLLHL